MRMVLVLCLLTCLAVYASPKQLSWQDATVAKIESSTTKTEELEYRPGPAAGTVQSTGVNTRHTQIWTYAFKTGEQLYLGKVKNKPVQGIREGDRIRIAVHRGVLYVLTQDAKERKLELLKSE